MSVGEHLHGKYSVNDAMDIHVKVQLKSEENSAEDYEQVRDDLSVLDCRQPSKIQLPWDFNFQLMIILYDWLKCI